VVNAPVAVGGPAGTGGQVSVAGTGGPADAVVG